MFFSYLFLPQFIRDKTKTDKMKGTWEEKGDPHPGIWLKPHNQLRG